MSQKAEQLAEAVQVLMKYSIPSISPQTATFLLRIYSELGNIPNCPELLKAYQQALRFICDLSALHQAAVIGKLEALVAASKEL